MVRLSSILLATWSKSAHLLLLTVVRHSHNMTASMFDGWELPVAADFHVHLRDGAMMEAVTPTIREGGVDTVFVMV